jgi:UDP:flavonoid glycosyltransferase YjiC (YdhE family)
MVVIPGLAGDQPFVAAAIEEWGAGRALPGDAAVDAIRSAAREVLGDASFGRAARRRAAALAGIDAANRAAAEVEALLEPAAASR